MNELPEDLLMLLDSCLLIAEDYRDTKLINGGATREELHETISKLTGILKENSWESTRHI